MTGTATIDFGTAGQWNTDTSVVVTGISAIQSGSYVEAYLQADSTADNDVDSHIIASSLIDFVVGAIIPGTGFTVYGISDGDVTGRFQVRWATA